MTRENKRPGARGGEQTGPNTSDHFKQNYTPPSRSKRTRATLGETVDAMADPVRIGALVFRATIYNDPWPFAVFLAEPQVAYPLICEPGASRLRLALERAAVGVVGRATLQDALTAAVLPIIDGAEFNIRDEGKLQRLPDRGMRLLNLMLERAA